MAETTKKTTQKGVATVSDGKLTPVKAGSVRADDPQPQTHVNAVRANTLAACCARAIVKHILGDAATVDTTIKTLAEMVGCQVTVDGSLKPLIDILEFVEHNPAKLFNTTPTKTVAYEPIEADAVDQTHGAGDSFIQVEVRSSHDYESLFIPRELVDNGILTGGDLKHQLNMLRSVMMPEYMSTHHVHSLIDACQFYAKKNGYKFLEESDPINMVSTVIGEGWF